SRRALHRELQRLRDARRAVAPRDHGAATAHELVDRFHRVACATWCRATATSASTATAAAATTAATSVATDTRAREHEHVELRRKIAGHEIVLVHDRVRDAEAVEQPLCPVHALEGETDARRRSAHRRAGCARGALTGDPQLLRPAVDRCGR